MAFQIASWINPFDHLVVDHPLHAIDKTLWVHTLYDAVCDEAESGPRQGKMLLR
jgi:hypothetical protein